MDARFQPSFQGQKTTGVVVVFYFNQPVCVFENAGSRRSPYTAGNPKRNRVEQYYQDIPALELE